MINLFQRKEYQTKLTPKKLDQEIKRFMKETTKLAESWDNKLFVDLSNMEWINTTALVELILRIEGLIENGVNVIVALPNRNMLHKDELHLKQSSDIKRIIEKSIENRKEVRAWLYRLGIIKALSFEHQPKEIRSNIKVLDVFDKDLFRQNPVEEESSYYKIHGPKDAKQKNLGEKYHVPLLWTKGANYNADHVKEILKLCLNSTHAQVISDVVIKELAKNVNEHSNKKCGLFCAVVKKHNPKKIMGTDYFTSELTFFNECRRDEYIAEIVFGDSGRGIIETLRKYGQGKTGSELIKFAFDKWSTAKPYDNGENSYLRRGTRGLYHVRRVMMNYEGIAAIRTENYFAGFNDLTIEPIDEKNLQPYDGTLLTIKLLPDRAKTLSGRYYPTSKHPKEKARDCERLSINMGNIDEGIRDVWEISKDNSKRNLLISLDFKDELKGNRDSNSNSIEENLRELLGSLSNLRHPNVHIVYGFPVNYESTDFDRIIDGVNEDTKRRQEKDKYLVFDPIMLIGPKGRIHWAGVQDKKFLLFLNEMIETEQLSLPVELINEGEYKELADYIKQDTELFTTKDGIIRLNFNKNAPIDHFNNELQKIIEDRVKKGEEKERVLITPHLKCAKEWFDIKKIYDDYKNEYALSLYSLWHNNRFQMFKILFPDKFSKKEKQRDYTNEELNDIQKTELTEKGNLKILVENEVDIPSGKMFMHLLGIEHQGDLKILSDEVDSKKPRRNRLFDEGDYVIIITSVVSTRETAKNLIKSVLRSNAIPVCILSLADFSGIEHQNGKKTIDQWGNSTLFYPIITTKKLIATEPKKDVKFKSLIGTVIEDEPKDTSYFIDEQLREGILVTKSLHFSHIGKPNGRHFTFYFNAKRFLKYISDEKNGVLPINMWKKFDHFISKWHKKISSLEYDEATNNIRKKVYTLEELNSAFSKTKNEVYIWHPGPEYKKGYQGQGLDLSYIIKEGIKERSYFKSIIAESISRDDVAINEDDEYPTTEKNLIIVDWGSITGESIEKLIYKAHRNGFKNILVCIFLNQLPENKNIYLKSISNISSKFSLYKKEEIPIGPDGQLILNYMHKKQFGEPLGKQPFSSNIEIKFIYDFLLTCYESDYECNVCALREDLEKYEIPNATLKDHAKSRRMVLDIRPREITKNEPFDFYSGSYDINDDKFIPLDQEFILRMFEFKTLLIYAQTSTYWRFQIKIEFIRILKSIIEYKDTGKINPSSENENIIWTQMIEACTNITNHFKSMFPQKYNEIDCNDYHIDEMLSRTHAMVYFLSIETSWIQKPPLSNAELRNILSLISRAIIFNSNLKISTKNGIKDKNVVRIKYAATTVLRMSDKNDFISNIFNILKNTQIDDIGSNSILENVLFHTNTFISKDYHAKHSDLDKVKHELNRTEILFDKVKNKKSALIKEANISLNLNIDNLIIRGQVRKLKIVDLVKNCLSDIEKGIEIINYNHPALIQKFRDLELKKEYTSDIIFSKKEDHFIKSYNKNWLYVSGFIKNIIGVYLNAIKSILDPKWGFSKGLRRLQPCLNIKNFGVDDEFSLSIRQIDDSLLNLTEKTFRDTYKEQYNNIRDIFISHPRFDENNSIVFDVLEKLHGDLSKSLDDAIAKHPQSQIHCNCMNNMNYTVFYPQDLLDELMEHLFKNGIQKKIPNTIAEITFNLMKETDEHILLHVEYKNTHQHINKGSETGLKKHQDIIRRFDGEMKYDPEKKEAFSVEIKMTRY